MSNAVLGLVFYFFFEMFIRWLSYDYSGIGSLHRSNKYKLECWKDIIILVSPGYWAARYFKDIIRSHPDYLLCYLGKYIKQSNYFNLWSSVALFFILACLWGLEFGPWFFESFVYWRFVSRSFEISYAFGNDAVNGHVNQISNLTKYDRIRLALLSYVEIFIYSACLYQIRDWDLSPLCAFLKSLGVGLFVNVDNALQGALPDLFVYIQVVTTLCLVVLSLAVYVGRAD